MFQDSKYEYFNYIHLEKNSRYVVDLSNDSKNLQWIFSGTSNFFSEIHLKLMSNLIR